MTMTPEEKLAMARECQKEAYRMAQDDVTTFRDYGVQSALLAIDRMQERVRAETDWQDIATAPKDGTLIDAMHPPFAIRRLSP